jgi:hypothetical protein
VDDDETPPPEPVSPPVAPYTPEDDVYQAIVSQYLGLRRCGADPLGAALITAANLTIAGMASGAAQQQDTAE